MFRVYGLHSGLKQPSISSGTFRAFVFRDINISQSQNLVLVSFLNTKNPLLIPKPCFGIISQYQKPDFGIISQYQNPVARVPYQQLHLPSLRLFRIWSLIFYIHTYINIYIIYIYIYIYIYIERERERERERESLRFKFRLCTLAET